MPWVLIFLGALIPNIFCFKYLWKKENSKSNIKDSTMSLRQLIKCKLAIIAMAFMFFECIIFFSLSGVLLGNLGMIIAFPIFMIFIILTSNFWGWFFREWYQSSSKAKFFMFLAILILVIAVLFQTSAYFFS